MHTLRFMICDATECTIAAVVLAYGSVYMAAVALAYGSVYMAYSLA
jgi:hypothetical protein